MNFAGTVVTATLDGDKLRWANNNVWTKKAGSEGVNEASIDGNKLTWPFWAGTLTGDLLGDKIYWENSNIWTRTSTPALTMAPCTGSDNQRWVLEDSGDLKSQKDGITCIDLADLTTSPMGVAAGSCTVDEKWKVLGMPSWAFPAQLVHYGKDMQDMPAGQTKLGQCEGDCDTSDDCQPGLYCYQKDTSDDVPPGCTAGGEGDRTKADYCVKPSHAPGELVHYGKSGENKPNGQLKLGECEGDCDKDVDCQPGLYCYQKDTSDDVPPGCTAGGKGDRMKADYCVKSSE